MNIYLLKQSGHPHSASYDAWVVTAKNEEDARKVNPFNNNRDKRSPYWNTDTNPYEQLGITCTCVGIANNTQEEGIVICASFQEGKHV